MSPELLKAYLEMLPASTHQIVLKEGSFEIQLNLAGPMGAGVPDAAALNPGVAKQAFDADGNPLDPVVAETFPHLVKTWQ